MIPIAGRWCKTEMPRAGSGSPPRITIRVYHGDTEARLQLFVVGVELVEVVRQLAVSDRVPGVEPVAEQDVAVLQTLLQYVAFHSHPLLEQIVLRGHPLGDQMAPALQDQLSLV